MLQASLFHVEKRGQNNFLGKQSKTLEKFCLSSWVKKG